MCRDHGFLLVDPLLQLVDPFRSSDSDSKQFGCRSGVHVQMFKFSRFFLLPWSEFEQTIHYLVSIRITRVSEAISCYKTLSKAPVPTAFTVRISVMDEGR